MLGSISIFYIQREFKINILSINILIYKYIIYSNQRSNE